MFAAYVTFQLDDRFDPEMLRKISEQARSIFVGLPQLRNKYFTIDAANRRAVNVYIWESEAAARAFFDEALLQKVSELYGVKPRLEFAEVAAFVDNSELTQELGENPDFL